MKNATTIALLGLIAVAIAGCAANPSISELGSDTFMLSRIDKGGIFGNAAAMKADVIREANEFAARRGKVAVPLSVSETPLRPCPGCFASIEYQFRVVDRNDPEVRRGQLVPTAARTEITIKKEPVTTPVPGQLNERPSADTYTELLKLDDLLKRGILTQAEFDSQKTKLLQAK
jgi:hypothetical protein